MASGLDTMASIDQALHQVRRDIQDLDRQIRAASDKIIHMNQDQTNCLRELAELRLDQLTSGPLFMDLDDADQRVTELLRDRAKSLQALQEQIEESDRRQSTLEADRATQQQKVHAASASLDRGEAGTQQRLAREPGYQEQLKRAQNSDRVAKHAEQKAQQAHKDRLNKGQEFEADSLFVYLWKRGFGTSKYSANPLMRTLDGWVAKLCRYHDARPNYTMLLEIPKRLGEHAEDLRKEADREFEALRELEEQASAADGIPGLRENLQQEEQRAQDIDDAIQKEEMHYSELVKLRSEFAGGEDAYSRQCLEILLNQLRREPLAQLRREAEQTSFPEDNIVVGRLADLDQAKLRLESQLAEHKQLHLRYLDRLEELEKIRWNFKQKRFDDIHSAFPDGSPIGGMLNEFLKGMVSSGQLWGIIEQLHRRLRIEADPNFGSGSLGRSSGSTWRLPAPAPHQSQSYSMGGGGDMGGGGGFRTGGGF
ncbi:MAG: hypothetical protein JW829_18025 [Pirellulales bacterium]|nr:hypothetical protein [Pirellulales bacterium]